MLFISVISLVSDTKMLDGDEASNAMYNAIYSSEGHADLLLSYTKIDNDSTLDFVYNHIEANPYPITQAVYWLESEEASHVAPELVDWYHDCCSFDVDSGG